MLLSTPDKTDSFVQFITVLLIFVFVLAITLFVTRWIAKFQKGMVSGKNIEIIETMRVSSTQYIQIVRIASEYVAIGVSKDSMTMLTKLDESQIVVCDNKEGQEMNFADILAKFKKAETNTEDNAENSDENN